jgi:gluconate 2-dehydrogenase gamma chain
MRRKLSRRKFIQVALTAAAVGPAISCGGAKSPWRFFTAEEAKTLAAICERIVPTDQDPGAAWAGVVNFLDRQLSGTYKRFRAAYRRGLAGVEQSSVALCGKRFVELPAPKQDEVLTALEKGGTPGEVWKQLYSREFFALLVNHTMQGFYGDPRHGGNRETVSWKMLGLPYPPIRGVFRHDLAKS